MWFGFYIHAKPDVAIVATVGGGALQAGGQLWRFEKISVAHGGGEKERVGT